MVLTWIIPFIRYYVCAQMANALSSPGAQMKPISVVTFTVDLYLYLQNLCEAVIIAITSHKT